MARIVRVFMIFAMVVSFANTSFAQNTEESSKDKYGPRRQLATIIFAGLGGAVLGLSTLSFYGRPQDKLSNIAIGFAVGVIAGTVYVTYGAATKPKEFYGQSYLPENQSEALRSQYMIEQRFAAQESPPVLNYVYNF